MVIKLVKIQKGIYSEFQCPSTEDIGALKLPNKSHKPSKMSIFDPFISIYRPHKFDGGFMGHDWAWLLN